MNDYRPREFQDYIDDSVQGASRAEAERSDLDEKNRNHFEKNRDEAFERNEPRGCIGLLGDAIGYTLSFAFVGFLAGVMAGAMFAGFKLISRLAGG